MSEKDYIARCRKQIEEEFNLEGSNLMERDYEYLHKVILETTRTDLSTSTLRRLWTDKYQAVPQIKTLDALVQLIGYSGWHMYKQSFSKEQKRSEGKRSHLVLYALGLILLLVSGWLFISSDAAVGKVSLEPEVTSYQGVPATIGFNYLVSNPKVEIELSWNPYERVFLDMDHHFYTGTYYYPDYHQAKLLYKDQVLAQKAVHVTTRGWHALLMDSGMDTRPQYIDSADFTFTDRLAISHQVITKLDAKTEELYAVFTLSNESLSQLSGDNFSLSGTINVTPAGNENLCLFYEILIKGSEGNMRIPVTQTGCYGIVTLVCAEKKISGKRNDLSDLSTDVTQEHQVKISSHGKKLSVQVGSNSTYELPYEQEIGTLKVIKFIFNGLPEVTAFELRNEKNKIVKMDQWHPFN